MKGSQLMRLVSLLPLVLAADLPEEMQKLTLSPKKLNIPQVLTVEIMYDDDEVGSVEMEVEKTNPSDPATNFYGTHFF